MKNIIRTAAFICAIAMSVSSMSAVSVSAADNTEQSTSSSKEETGKKQTRNVKLGKVTAVSGNKITVALGKTGKGTPPVKPSGNGADPNGNTTPPEKPSGNGYDPNGNTTPPEMPSGNGYDPNGNTTPPEMPSGNGNGNPPAMPSGDNMGKIPSADLAESGKTVTVTISDGVSVKKNGKTVSVSDIAEGDIIMLMYDDSNALTAVEIMDMNGGGKGKPGRMDRDKGSAELSGKEEADGKTKSCSSENITVSEKDKSAVLAKNGGNITLNSCTVTKKGDTSSVDSSNFYALNAAVAAQEGSSVTISGGKIITDAEGANAVFATGENSKITVSDTTINTNGNSSRGLDATYGGTVIASDVTINTSGAHCAPLATDRGGGTIKAASSRLYASGDGSPCIYSTGDITASDCTGKATGSQIAVVEGKNSITLNKCTLTGAGKDGVMIYQSTSGDAAVGTGNFTAYSSTLTTTSDGPMFYITNTDAVITLKNTKLVFGSGILLKASGNNTNNWGTPG
ncbi:MAG: hypothetical protein K6C13_16695, partial [Oscillospiraceae bacterium]|nr:hypothetical protein [Oscillospiraceae bacterium]